MIRRLLTSISIVTLVAVFGALANSVAARAAVADTTATHRCSAGNAASSALHHAGLVVTFGDRHTQTFCVEFSEDTITGLQLLQRSGLPIVTSSGGQGAAVCSIGGQGSDSTNCFASCTGSTCAYWAYYQFANGAWKFSQVGAAQRVVHDGDVDGWAWGPGGLSSGAVPEQPGVLCPVPSPTPIPPTSTVVVVAQPTSPPLVPTITPVPSLTSVLPTAPSGATTVPEAEPSRTPSPPSTSELADDAVPTRTAEGAVAGAQVTRPPATSATAQAPVASTVASPTPKAGAVIVSNEQGATNEAHSTSRTATTGGNRTSLIAFGAVVLALSVVAGIVAYRRKGTG